MPRFRDSAPAPRDPRDGRSAPPRPTGALTRLATALRALGLLPELLRKVDYIMTQIQDLQAAEGRAEALLGQLAGLVASQSGDIRTLTAELAAAHAAGDDAGIAAVIQKLNAAADTATAALADAGVTAPPPADGGPSGDAAPPAGDPQPDPLSDPPFTTDAPPAAA